MSALERREERSSKVTIVGILVVMAAIAFGISFVSSPTEKLLGASVYGIHSAIHGLVAGVLMVTMTIGLFQAFRLWSGAPIHVAELKIGSLVNAAVCFLTIVAGNWIYIPYRAGGGPRAHFLETAPEIHRIFFEFKEYTALLTFPLVVAATSIIFCYGEKMNTNKSLREMTSLLLVLAFFYFAVAFGLGAAITKLKSV